MKVSVKKTPPAWHLLLAFVLTLAFLAGLIGWLQNVHIFTTNGMFKSILTEPWIHDPVNASLDHSNYLYYPLYGRLCALLDFLGFMRGQAWRQFAYLNAFWASIGSVFVYAFAYRLSGSPAASAGATVFHAGTGFVLLLLFAYAMTWISALVGLSVRSVEVAQSAGFIWLFPFSFLSNAFVPLAGMPPVIRTIAEWNPVSSLVMACRELFGNPTGMTSDAWPLQHAAAYTVLSCVVVIALFAPAAVRRYRRG